MSRKLTICAVIAARNEFQYLKYLLPLYEKLDYGWFAHHDADEILQHREAGGTLMLCRDAQ